MRHLASTRCCGLARCSRRCVFRGFSLFRRALQCPAVPRQAVRPAAVRVTAAAPAPAPGAAAAAHPPPAHRATGALMGRPPVTATVTTRPTATRWGVKRRQPEELSWRVQRGWIRFTAWFPPAPSALSLPLASQAPGRRFRGSESASFIFWEARPARRFAAAFASESRAPSQEDRH